MLSHAEGRWVARARVDLRDLGHAALVRSTGWSDTLRSGAEGAVGTLRAGGFGQLGLRDVRLVTHADGSPVTDGTAVWLTATSAGPGFFPTAHASVWRLETDTLALSHAADLFFARDGADGTGTYGDHAVHLVHEQDAWLVATSTWSDFDKQRHPHVGVQVGRSRDDLLSGRHVVATTPLDLPVDGLGSVGTWDPHLLREPDGSWLVAFVSARRFFVFHPAVAAGPSLDRLRLVAADPRRRATEGSTLHRLSGSTGTATGSSGSGAWRLLASDGRDGPRATRARYPVLEARGEWLVETGVLDAAYPTNLPWPTLVPCPGRGTLLVTFDGTRHGGPLAGYGTHGDLVVLRGQ